MKAAEKRGRPIYGPDAPSWWFGYLVRNTVGWFASRLYRVRFIGAENVPAGGAILAGNHVSYLDPVLLWAGSVRPAHFMGKIELWETRWLGWCLDNFWVFPVNRAGADREAIMTASRLLGQGELVGIFPEGTRKRENQEELGEAQGGVAFIAMRAGAPIVPVGIAGTDRAWPPGKKIPRLVKVTISYGEPISPDDFEGGRKEKVEAMTAAVMRRIAAEREKARAAR